MFGLCNESRSLARASTFCPADPHRVLPDIHGYWGWEAAPTRQKGGPSDLDVCLVRPFFEEPTYLVYLNVEIKLTFQKFLGGSCPLSAPLPGDLLQPFLRVLVMGKAALVVAKGAGVVIAPAIDEPRRVLHVK